MMDELESDSFARDIFQSNKLDLTNAAFDKMVMQKIYAQSKRQKLIRNILLYVLIFVTVDALLFAILKLFNLEIAKPLANINAINDKAGDLLKATGSLTGIYMVVLCVVMSVFLISILKITVSSFSRAGK